MEEVYRIIVSPYGFDFYNIFTKDQAVFDQFVQLGNVDQVINQLGHEVWDDLTANHVTEYEPPYVLLGETVLHQRN